jgi:hypothetical protein
MGNLLVSWFATIGLPGVIEDLAVDTLSGRRQMLANGWRKLLIRSIRHPAIINKDCRSELDLAQSNRCMLRLVALVKR